MTSHQDGDDITMMTNQKNNNNNNNNGNSNSAQTISVYFTTKITDLVSILPTTQFEIPLHLTRKGLSELINQLAQELVEQLKIKASDDQTTPTSSYQPRSFDFLIGDKLNNQSFYLRSNLLNYIVNHRLSVEQDLYIQVVEIFQKPELKQSTLHPDWISSISHHTASNLIVTASFDGSVRIIDNITRDIKLTHKAHNNAIKHVQCLNYVNTAYSTTNQKQQFSFVTVSKDRTISTWQYDITQNKINHLSTNEQVYDYSFETCCTLDTTSKYASAGYDGNILFWDHKIVDMELKSQMHQVQEQTELIQDEPAKKKTKLANGKVVSNSSSSSSAKMPTQQVLPLSMIESAHSQCINSLVWPDESTIYSCSNDHTICQFATHDQREIYRWNIPHKTITSIDFNLNSNSLLAATNDGRIHAFDPRIHQSITGEVASSQNKSQAIYKSHTKWVSNVAFSKQNPFQFVSSSYDSTIKIWDTRSTIPLTTIDNCRDKVLALDLIESTSDDSQKKTIVAGGQDKQVHFY